MLHTMLKDKGQITLPAEVRKKLNASKGDIFSVRVEGGQVVLTLQKLVDAVPNELGIDEKYKSKPVTDFFGSMPGHFGTAEEIDAYIREERDSWDR